MMLLDIESIKPRLEAIEAKWGQRCYDGQQIFMQPDLIELQWLIETAKDMCFDIEEREWAEHEEHDQNDDLGATQTTARMAL